jgi:glyoxylase-like metal-dependent hydrolase (beta-lactamase superfamily II)
VLIDSGPNPPDSLIILEAVKKLTSQPIRFLINTETHNDHTTGNFVFSPPAIVVASAGATAGMKSYYSPQRNEKLMAESAEMRDAFRGFRLVIPHVEFTDRLILNLGDRTLELLQLNKIHSDADTAIWLPKEGVLFSAATAAGFRPFSFLKSGLDVLNGYKRTEKAEPSDRRRRPCPRCPGNRATPERNRHFLRRPFGSGRKDDVRRQVPKRDQSKPTPA